MREFVNPLADIGDKVQKLTMEIGMKAMQQSGRSGRGRGAVSARGGAPGVLVLLGPHGRASRSTKEGSGRSVLHQRSWPPRASTSPKLLPGNRHRRSAQARAGSASADGAGRRSAVLNHCRQAPRIGDAAPAAPCIA